MSAHEGFTGVRKDRLLSSYFDASEYSVTVLRLIEEVVPETILAGDGLSLQGRKLAEQARLLHVDLLAMYRRIDGVSTHES
ncbi:hypothetical protein [Amycolatopsis azurea]|uniref:Uncharacterized protein n=1 Tax=Amycolatopsis azurea DSM 43854 TaxID=1238180 RepID=A0ABX3J932_9PSEU|nr:hypothetical protein [Amycolatopsis azurea]OOC03800.1 hypothetical protein B0293_26430 [Amycolatopsis azurea DSM 43854]